MEDNVSEDSSSEREISSSEDSVPPEVRKKRSRTSGNSSSSSQMMESNLSSGHELIRTTKRTNLLEPEVSTPRYTYNSSMQFRQVPDLYLISNRLETVPENQNSWTNTRRFMSFRHAYICRIPKHLVTNGIIRQTLQFVTRNTVQNFRMELQLLYRGRIIDEWQFVKGLVHRDVINRWETTIRRSPNSYYFDPSLTACTMLKTRLYDGDQFLVMYYTCIIFT